MRTDKQARRENINTYMHVYIETYMFLDKNSKKLAYFRMDFNAYP